MKTPYRHADKSLKKLLGNMGKEFQDLSVSVPFDELNVIRVKKQVNAMYTRINKDVKREFKQMARKVRKDTEEEIGEVPGRFMGALLIASLLKRYDPVTKYVYNAEWERKRDRLVESMMASRNRQEVRISLKRALDLLVMQVKQYADNLTDEVRLKTFADAGVKTVVWHTQEDERVCKVCRERDGQRYGLSNIPDKHWRCRCYLKASKD